MKFAASAAALTFLGTANAFEAVLQSIDSYGRILSTDTTEFQPGEDFSIQVNLAVAPQLLDVITLETEGYGVKSCDLYVNSNYRDTLLKKDMTMCEFPHHEFGKNFLGRMGLANYLNYNFVYGDLTFICTATDVTLKKDKDIGCES